MAALALVKPADLPAAVQETNKVYAIFADGKRSGIAVARDEHAALAGAVRLLTRRTRMDEDECGYRTISVRPI